MQRNDGYHGVFRMNGIADGIVVASTNGAFFPLLLLLLSQSLQYAVAMMTMIMLVVWCVVCGWAENHAVIHFLPHKHLCSRNSSVMYT